MSIKNEAEIILNFLKEEFGMTREVGYIHPGYYIDGWYAINWMKDMGFTTWRQIEWTGYFIRHLAQEHFLENPEFNIKPITEARKYRLLGKHLWDLRFNNYTEKLIPLTDARNLEQNIIKHKGIGIIVINAMINPDTDDSFRLAVEELKGGPSPYEERRREEGAPIRPRKKGFFALWGCAYFIKPEDITGDTETWLLSNFQKNMRNSDNKLRNAKYAIDRDNIPDEKEVARINFNMDPEEFKKFISDKLPFS